MKTVAAISFRDNHSVSMDIENVQGIDLGTPMDAGDGKWFCELIVRTDHGIVALQLLADSPERFRTQGG